MIKKSTDVVKAANYLRENNVVAIPTETVYGLAANIFSKTAVASIYKIKNRPQSNPLIVHIKSEDELENYAKDIPEKAKVLAKTFWPGPLTLVLNKTDLIPDYISANKSTVAIRVPSHPLLASLLNELEFPLAAPSANPSNCVSATTAESVENYFKNEIPLVLDGGPCEKGLESTIIGFENGAPVLYRLGALTLDTIENVIGKVFLKNELLNQDSPNAPGMFLKHYAPKTPLYIIENEFEFLEQLNFENIAFLGFDRPLQHSKIKEQFLLSKNGDLNEAAFNLYRTLEKIDTLEFDGIVVKWFPNTGIGMSINDRIKRASIK